MEQDVAQLKTKVQELERKLKELESSNTIPRSIDQSFAGRFGKALSVGSYTQADLERNIILTGNAQTINVLEYPTKFITYQAPNGEILKIAAFS